MYSTMRYALFVVCSVVNSRYSGSIPL